ncbi:MAG TPA: serine/threonine-protein kinase [Gaiellaceae bacterium]|nr:serine/threonine-protein kinase [Gaiellaceae bacterium]
MPAPFHTSLPPRYRDARPLAHGGMGEILLATDRELGREVAVKVLSARYAKDDDLRERFRREALAAARLSGNPNIVTIFDVDEHDGRPMIVMEYLPGGSLEQRIAGRRCPPAQALDWLGETAAAVDAAHAAGVVHRDIKPGNLLLDDHGHVHVGDFGIASAAGLASFTQAGTILGTAGYLSPEQARGERAGPASDRYSLGVVAWELLAGRRPFESSSPTTEASAHVNAPVPSIHAANPSLPASYDAIFRRALAKDPAARFRTGTELVGALRRGLHDDDTDTDTWPLPPALRSPPVRARSRRPLWLPALAALALAAATAAAVVLLTRGGPKPTVLPPRTVIHTVTTTATTPPPAARGGESGAALNDAGYAKMRAGDFPGALPLLQQAVEKLRGAGSLDEAYADYNLAYTRFALHRCNGLLQLLDASEEIQGHRPEIDGLRAEAQRACR